MTEPVKSDKDRAESAEAALEKMREKWLETDSNLHSALRGMKPLVIELDEMRERVKKLEARLADQCIGPGCEKCEEESHTTYPPAHADDCAISHNPPGPCDCGCHGINGGHSSCSACECGGTKKP
jgi:hypothetical protein